MVEGGVAGSSLSGELVVSVAVQVGVGLSEFFHLDTEDSEVDVTCAAIQLQISGRPEYFLITDADLGLAGIICNDRYRF